MLRKWYDYIYNHNIFNKVAANIIYTALVALAIWLYSFVKNISFISAFESIIFYKLSFWIYFLVTLIGIIIYRIIRNSKKSETHAFEETKIISDTELQSAHDKPVANNLILDSNLISEDAVSAENQRNWDNPTKKFIGIAAQGDCSFENRIITIKRTNLDGKFLVSFDQYFFHSKTLSFVPANVNGKSPRHFQVSYFARSISGSHRITTVFRSNIGYDWLNNSPIEINNKEWQKQTGGFAMESDKDFRINLHIHTLSKIPSTLQIKDFLVEESN